MRQRARRKWLNGNSGRGQGPRVAEPVHDGARIESAAGSLKETERSFQDVGSSGPAQRRKIHGHGAVLSGVPGVERLGHGAEIVAQSSALCRRHAQGICRLLCIKAAQLGAGRRAAKRAAGAGGMKSVIVVAGIDRFGDFGLDFHAKVIRQHEILAGALGELADGEGGSERSDARMGQQAVDAILGHGKLRIVEIVGVNGNAIRKGGKPRRRLHARADNGGLAAYSKPLQVLVDEGRHHRCRARQRQSKAVQNGLAAQFQDVSRNVGVFRIHDEFRDIFREPGSLGKWCALGRSRRCGQSFATGATCRECGHGQRSLDEISADHGAAPSGFASGLEL